MPEARIAAAIVWYDEPVEFLQRCVRSLAGVADVLVAVDGAWQGFAGGPVSAVEQGDAIRAAGAEAGLHVEVWAPHRVWESQVVKRASAMELAGASADWVLVIDGDEFLEPVDSAALRWDLAASARDVATVMLRSLNRPWPLKHLAPMQIEHRRLYRAGTTVSGPAHNVYRRGDAWLNGDRHTLALAPALNLSGLVTIAHDNGARPKTRVDAAVSYRRVRRAHGLEAYA